VESVTYKASYRGGFANMRATPRAELTLGEEFVAVRRVRRTLGLRRVWARWRAVTTFELEPGDEGTMLTLETKTRGPATVVVADVEPIEIWTLLARRADSARLVPADVLGELGVSIEELEALEAQAAAAAEPADGDADDVEDHDEVVAESDDEGAAEPHDGEPIDPE